jgi:hypothetical protein
MSRERVGRDEIVLAKVVPAATRRRLRRTLRPAVAPEQGLGMDLAADTNVQLVVTGAAIAAEEWLDPQQ